MVMRAVNHPDTDREALALVLETAIRQLMS
jgi:hypothetical protein